MAQPPSSSTDPSIPATINTAITASTNTAYTAAGPIVRATRRRIHSCLDVLPSTGSRDHDTALAYPATAKNTGTTWKNQVSHWVQGIRISGLSRPNAPSRKVITESSQCPMTTIITAADRYRSSAISRAGDGAVVLSIRAIVVSIAAFGRQACRRTGKRKSVRGGT